jgi:ribose-phosphate pyrophosphokinase
MISYTLGFKTTHVNVWKFPDGGVGVNINTGDARLDFCRQEVEVNIHFGEMKDQRGKDVNMSDQIIALMQTMDALRRHFVYANFTLNIPYLPYARQDRICKVGEGHSLKVFGNLINSMGFDSVVVFDPHSSVADACINNLHVVDQYAIFGQIYTSFHDVYIVAPDQGATKKCEAFAERTGAAGVITCMKHRVGDTVQLRLLDEIPTSFCKLLVLDDICDGGRTFIEVAKVIEENTVVAQLDLAVTHGLFTQGVDVVAKPFDTVYTTDFFNSDKNNSKVVVIKR